MYSVVNIMSKLSDEELHRLINFTPVLKKLDLQHREVVVINYCGYCAEKMINDNSKFCSSSCSNSHYE